MGGLFLGSGLEFPLVGEASDGPRSPGVNPVFLPSSDPGGRRWTCDDGSGFRCGSPRRPRPPCAPSVRRSTCRRPRRSSVSRPSIRRARLQHVLRGDPHRSSRHIAASWAPARRPRPQDIHPRSRGSRARSTTWLRLALPVSMRRTPPARSSSPRRAPTRARRHQPPLFDVAHSDRRDVHSGSSPLFAGAPLSVLSSVRNAGRGRRVPDQRRRLQPGGLRGDLRCSGSSTGRRSSAEARLSFAAPAHRARRSTTCSRSIGAAALPDRQRGRRRRLRRDAASLLLRRGHRQRDHGSDLRRRRCGPGRSGGGAAGRHLGARLGLPPGGPVSAPLHLQVGTAYTLVFHNVDVPSTPNPQHGFSGISELGIPATDDISPGHDFVVRRSRFSRISGVPTPSRARATTAAPTRSSTPEFGGRSSWSDGAAKTRHAHRGWRYVCSWPFSKSPLPPPARGERVKGEGGSHPVSTSFLSESGG